MNSGKREGQSHCPQWEGVGETRVVAEAVCWALVLLAFLVVGVVWVWGVGVVVVVMLRFLVLWGPVMIVEK